MINFCSSLIVVRGGMTIYSMNGTYDPGMLSAGLKLKFQGVDEVFEISSVHVDGGYLTVYVQ